MTELIIKPQAKTLGVELSEGSLLFSGRSIVSDVKLFFEPVSEWVKKYATEPAKVTTVTFRLEYIDSPSTKCIMLLLKMIEGIQQKKGHSVTVYWHYALDDIEMLELGEIIKDRLDLEFNFYEFDEKYQD